MHTIAATKARTIVTRVGMFTLGRNLEETWPNRGSPAGGFVCE